MKKIKKYDIFIETIENGYIVTVGKQYKTTFVFKEFSDLIKWIEKNFKTIKTAKEFIKTTSSRKYDHSLVFNKVTDWKFLPSSSLVGKQAILSNAAMTQQTCKYE